MSEVDVNIQAVFGHQILRRGEYALWFVLYKRTEEEYLIKPDLELAQRFVDPKRNYPVFVDGYSAPSSIDVVSDAMTAFDVDPANAIRIMGNISENLGRAALLLSVPENELISTIYTLDKLRASSLQRFVASEHDNGPVFRY
jgi:hypothetical protein